MKTLTKLAAMAALVAGSAAQAGSADLVVTQVGNGNGTEFQFDILNDGGATAFQFELKLDSAGPIKVEAGNCLSGLPSTHTGGCNFANGVLKVAVISTSNAVLSSGSIGSISVSGASAGLKASVDGLMVGDPSGKVVQAHAIMDGAVAKENMQK